jgi:HEAT repeat protein
VDWRNKALHMLKLLGPSADPALPELIRQFNQTVAWGDRTEGDWAIVNAISVIGDAKTNYIPDFIRAIQQNWEPTALEAVYLLGSIGPKAKAAVPVLLEQLPRGDWEYSNAVTEAVWKIDRSTNLALEVFTNELLTFRIDSKTIPLRSLAEMGSAGEPAAPLVLALLTNFYYPVRLAAAKALQQIDRDLYRSKIDELNRNSSPNIERLILQVRSTNNTPIDRMNPDFPYSLYKTMLLTYTEAA